jgi:hypothetical protein
MVISYDAGRGDEDDVVIGAWMATSLCWPPTLKVTTRCGSTR